VDVVVRRWFQLPWRVAQGGLAGQHHHAYGVMNIPRSIEPEWLDELPPHDPRAIQSRRDLRRINALMTNATIVARELTRSLRHGPPRAIAEVGAGDGTFMLRLAEETATRWQGVHVVLLDRQDIVSSRTREQFSALGWQAESVTADVFDWLAQPAGQVFDVVIANLFLHHFDAAGLTALLSLAAQRTRMFIACEPRRSGLALIGSHLLGVVGCNDVSRHDAVVSVRAGFDGRELSALWPASRAWRLQERANGLFSHCFVASRVNGNCVAGRYEGI
jgi:Methyltransferase domain